MWGLSSACVLLSESLRSAGGAKSAKSLCCSKVWRREGIARHFLHRVWCEGFGCRCSEVTEGRGDPGGPAARAVPSWAFQMILGFEYEGTLVFCGSNPPSLGTFQVVCQVVKFHYCLFQGRAEEVGCQSRGTKEHTEGASDCTESPESPWFLWCFFAGPPCCVMKFLVSCLGVERSRRQKDAGSCCLTRGTCQGLLCQAGSTNASTKFCTGRWGCRPAALALWQIVGAFGELEQAGQYILSMLQIRMTRNNKMSRAAPG